MTMWRCRFEIAEIFLTVMGYEVVSFVKEHAKQNTNHKSKVQRMYMRGSFICIIKRDIKQLIACFLIQQRKDILELLYTRPNLKKIMFSVLPFLFFSSKWHRGTFSLSSSQSGYFSKWLPAFMFYF